MPPAASEPIALRIIAGELRGRAIRVPRGKQVRPTAGRVREALFSILGARVRGARVLDAYSGSGALGFEALSRGARQVVFIDADAAVVRVLRESAAGFDVARRCRIHHGRVLELLAGGTVGGRFELILADPPYANSEEVGLFLLRAAGLLATDGLLVLERDPHAEPVAEVPRGLSRLRTARYGSNLLEFYGPRSADASG